MEENGFPVAPAILGMVLGAMLEENFISSMIKADGSAAAFFERPIAGALGALAIAVVAVPLCRRFFREWDLASPKSGTDHVFLTRSVPCQRDAVHHPPVAVIVVHRVVLHAAVVPERERAGAASGSGR